MNLNEQSRKLQVHGKDIHKFGKVPSLTPGLQKNDVWQTCGVSLEGKSFHGCSASWKGSIAWLPRASTVSRNLCPFLTSLVLPQVLPWLLIRSHDAWLSQKRCGQWSTRDPICLSPLSVSTPKITNKQVSRKKTCLNHLKPYPYPTHFIQILQVFGGWTHDNTWLHPSRALSPGTEAHEEKGAASQELHVCRLKPDDGWNSTLPFHVGCPYKGSGKSPPWAEWIRSLHRASWTIKLSGKISSNKCARAFGHWLTRCALSMHSDVCGASLGVQWWWPWHRNTDWRSNELSDHNLVAVSTTYFSTLICLMCSATKAQPSKDLQICTKGSLPGSDPSKFPKQHF